MKKLIILFDYTEFFMLGIRFHQFWQAAHTDFKGIQYKSGVWITGISINILGIYISHSFKKIVFIGQTTKRIYKSKK